MNGPVTINYSPNEILNLPVGLIINGNLIVNAPNATVNNNAVVSGGTITINQVSGNTWNELVSVNTLVFNAEGKTLNIVNGVQGLIINKNATVITTQPVQAIVASGATVIVKAYKDATKGVTVVGGEGEKTLDPTPVAKAKVTFTKTPSDLILEVKKGTELVTAEQDGTYKLEAGNYTYTATKEGYTSLTDVPFTVSEEDVTSGKTVEVTMEITPTTTYAITFVAAVETESLNGATIKVYSDEQKQNEVTDYSKVEAGTYYYTVSKAGFEDVTGTVNVVNKEVEVVISLKQVVDTRVKDVTNFDELKAAVENPEVTTINIMNNINVLEKLNISSEKNINGNNHTLTGNNEGGWQGFYILHFYKTTGTVKDIKLTGADAAIYVNGSTVSLSGTIDVSGNEFGGIEVSKGVNVEIQPVLNIGTSILVNSNEGNAIPTVWEDQIGTTDADFRVTEYGNMKVDYNQKTVTNIQRFYYLSDSFSAPNSILKEKGEAIISGTTFTTSTTQYKYKEGDTIPEGFKAEDTVYTAESVRIPLNYNFAESNDVTKFKVTAYIGNQKLATNTLTGKPSTSDGIWSPFNFNQGGSDSQNNWSDWIRGGMTRGGTGFPEANILINEGTSYTELIDKVVVEFEYKGYPISVTLTK